MKLRDAGIDTIAKLVDVAAMRALIERVLGDARSGHLPVATDTAVHAADRRSRARELAKLLDEVTTARAGARDTG
jgi:hypothetical protein